MLRGAVRQSCGCALVHSGGDRRRRTARGCNWRGTAVTPIDRAPLLEVLRHPERAGALSLTDWSRAIASARHSSLLPRLSLLLSDKTMTELPARVRGQLLAARPIAMQHARAIRWEVTCIGRALQPLGTKVVVLKGAAYV